MNEELEAKGFITIAGRVSRKYYEEKFYGMAQANWKTNYSNNMLVKYEDMEEYEELEVTIIARLTSGNMVNSKKAFYDPLKDFMTLNRVMRRSISDGLYEIYADRDYRTIEILAIYQ